MFSMEAELYFIRTVVVLVNCFDSSVGVVTSRQTIPIISPGLFLIINSPVLTKQLGHHRQSHGGYSLLTYIDQIRPITQ